ncbi:hypothetical protein ACH4E7_10690 [Kitasatospora sp. NPDC018058]|uniref:hypothetical protein n=1 Tax=Kitasatospora sp. NPDC018058 TaxID=3364025 RepID=UPI0037C1356B
MTVNQDGGGVGFLVDATAVRLCPEGTMNQAATEADVFAGCPDRTGCDAPVAGTELSR